MAPDLRSSEKKESSPTLEERGDAQSGGQSGKQLSPFQLRQQGRGKPVSSPNSTESHALAQADGAQLFADRVGGPGKWRRPSQWLVLDTRMVR